MADNVKNSLISQICQQSGLSGSSLTALKARLEKLSEAELNAELQRLLTGNIKPDNTGLVVERTTTVSQSNSAPHPNQLGDVSELDKDARDALAKGTSISIISNNLKSANNIFTNKDYGIVRQGYDDLKSEFNIKKSSNVAKVIEYQHLGIALLADAEHNKLTRKEYYLKNKNHLVNLIITRMEVLKNNTEVPLIDIFRGDYSREELKEIIGKYIDTLLLEGYDSKNPEKIIENIKTLQKDFLKKDLAEEIEALNHIADSAKSYQEQVSLQSLRTVEGEPITFANSNTIPIEWNSDEIISFEEVYKLERGVDFSSEKVENFSLRKAELDNVINAFNLKEKFINDTKAIINENTSYQEKERKLFAFFNEFYSIQEGKGIVELNKILSQIKPPIQIVDGNLDFGTAYPDDEFKTRAIHNILRVAQQEKIKDFQAFLGKNKTIEDYQAAYQKASVELLGKEDSELLAEAMENDNITVIQRYTGMASTGGMVLTAVGGILCFTPFAAAGVVMLGAGNTLALGGMVAKNGLEALDLKTQNEQTEEEKNELTKNLIVDAGGFVVGMVAGKAGTKAFSKLIDAKLAAVYGQQIASGNKLQALKTVFTNPDYLRNFMSAAGVKISADFLISYVGDLTMMGVFDTQDDWQSLLKANLIGIMVGMAGDIKDISGAGVNNGVNRAVTPEARADVGATKVDVVAEEEFAPVVEGMRARENALKNGEPIPYEEYKLSDAYYDKDGNLIEERTYTKTSNNPLGKEHRYIDLYGNGFDSKIAETKAELVNQFSFYIRTCFRDGFSVSAENLVEQIFRCNPSLKISDISEIAHLLSINNGKIPINFLTNWDSVSKITDVETFKQNLTTMISLSEESRAAYLDQSSSSKFLKPHLSIVRLLENLTTISTEKLSTIEPEAFEANLRTVGVLDRTLQDVISKDYEFLFTKHSESDFARLKVLSDYNSYVQNELREKLGKLNYYKEEILECEVNVDRILSYTEEEFELFSRDLEALKEFTQRTTQVPLFKEYLKKGKGKFSEFCEKYKAEIPVEKQTPKVFEILLKYSDSTIIDASKYNQIKEYLLAFSPRLLELQSNYPSHYNAGLGDIAHKFAYGDDVDTKSYIVQAKMLSLLDSAYEEGFNSYIVCNFLSNSRGFTDIHLEFLECLDEKSLKRLASNGCEIKYFLERSGLSTEEDFKNAIEVAKLLKTLDPEFFEEYISMDDFDYSFNVDKLRENVEAINKNKGTIPNKLLNKVLNGEINLTEGMVDLITGLSESTISSLLSYMPELNDASDATLKEIKIFLQENLETKLLGEYEKDGRLRVFSHNCIKYITELTPEERAFLPQDLVFDHRIEESEFNNLKANLQIIPDNIKEMIKDADCPSYRSPYLTQIDESRKISIESIKALSPEMLKLMDADMIASFICTPRVTFNIDNIRAYMSLPDDIKTVLDSFRSKIFTRNEAFNPEVVIKRFRETSAMNLNEYSLLALIDLSDEKYEYAKEVFRKELQHNLQGRTDIGGRTTINSIITAISNNDIKFAEVMVSILEKYDLSTKDAHDITEVLDCMPLFGDGHLNNQLDLLDYLCKNKVDSKNIVDAMIKARKAEDSYSSLKDYYKYLIEDVHLDTKKLYTYTKMLSKVSDAETYKRTIDVNKDLIKKGYDTRDIERIYDSTNTFYPDNSEFNARLDIIEKLFISDEFDSWDFTAKVNIMDNIRLHCENLVIELLKAKRIHPTGIASILCYVDDDNISLAVELAKNADLESRDITKILEATKIHDAGDAGGNNGKIDPKKVERYTRLFQNPKTSAWASRMIREGFDVELTTRLVPTKQSFYSEDAIARNSGAGSGEVVKHAETINLFASKGLGEKEISAVIKAISENDEINFALEQEAIKLIDAGVKSNKIGEVINSAKITGKYNPQIVTDYIKIQSLGLNPLLEKNLAVLKNISGADVAAKFNSKVKKQLKGMLQNLTDEQKTALKGLGFDLDSINKKLDAQKVQASDKVPAKTKIESGFRSKAKITGFERILIDQFEPEEHIWRSEEATRKWANDKFETIRKTEFVSTRNTPEDPELGAKVTKKRAEILDEWYKFMDTDDTVKNDPFIKLVLADFITKNLEPETTALPEVFNKELVKKILSEASKNDGKISFGAAYAKGLQQESKNSTPHRTVEINGRKGTWFTVPKTDNSSPDFKANAAKVRAFSDGTNWCIRTWNAEPYIQRGNIHFFVDEQGLTQVCIREDSPGHIAEIQKRQQTQEVPVAYVDFIDEYIKFKYLNLDDNWKANQERALAKQPVYERTRGELQALMKEKKYTEIFDKMGIEWKLLPDGTYEISNYNSYFNDIALNDYGISENELLSCVSVIRGDASFKDSNATSLPNLVEVEGKLDFGYANISNLRSLKRVNGEDIPW